VVIAIVAVVILLVAVVVALVVVVVILVVVVVARGLKELWSVKAWQLVAVNLRLTFSSLTLSLKETTLLPFYITTRYMRCELFYV